MHERKTNIQNNEKPNDDKNLSLKIAEHTHSLFGDDEGIFLAYNDITTTFDNDESYLNELGDY